MIHIKAEHAGEQIRDVLPRHKGVRRIGVVRIPSPDVQHAVRPEPHVSPGMPAAQPGNHNHAARKIKPGRVRLRDLEAQHPRTFGNRAFPMQVATHTHVGIAVLREPRMESQRVRLGDFAVKFTQISEQVSPGRLPSRHEGHELAALLGDNQAIRTRQARDLEGIGKGQFRIQALHQKRGRGLGAALNPRRCPRNTLLGNAMHCTTENEAYKNNQALPEGTLKTKGRFDHTAGGGTGRQAVSTAPQAEHERRSAEAPLGKPHSRNWRPHKHQHAEVARSLPN